jgi:hypothetical protein
LIDRDVLIECKFKNAISYNAFVNLVKRQQTIDAVEVVHGEWKFIGDSEEPYDCAWMCSVCGKMYWVEDSNMVTEDAHYCPNC